MQGENGEPASDAVLVSVRGRELEVKPEDIVERDEQASVPGPARWSCLSLCEVPYAKWL